MNKQKTPFLAPFMAVCIFGGINYPKRLNKPSCLVDDGFNAPG